MRVDTNSRTKLLALLSCAVETVLVCASDAKMYLAAKINKEETSMFSMPTKLSVESIFGIRSRNTKRNNDRIIGFASYIKFRQKVFRLILFGL